MPCNDSSSSINLRLDHDERFVSFEFAKITCGREITAETGYGDYLCGKSLEDIMAIPFVEAVRFLKLNTEDAQFVLYLEWDALRSVIAQYVGFNADDIDRERCQITSIDHDERGVEVALVILPPKELPKILPCNLANN
jgi:hypothetical protein